MTKKKKKTSVIYSFYLSFFLPWVFSFLILSSPFLSFPFLFLFCPLLSFPFLFFFSFLFLFLYHIFFFFNLCSSLLFSILSFPFLFFQILSYFSFLISSCKVVVFDLVSPLSSFILYIIIIYLVSFPARGVAVIKEENLRGFTLQKALCPSTFLLWWLTLFVTGEGFLVPSPTKD